MARPKFARAPGPDAQQVLAGLVDRRRVRDSRAGKLMLAIRNAELRRAAATIRIGRSLRALLAESLYANLGHASFRSLLVALGIGRSQAFKLMSLGERAAAARLAEVGVEAAYAEVMTSSVRPTLAKENRKKAAKSRERPG